MKIGYNKDPQVTSKEVWREETVRVDTGGYNLEMTGLKEGDIVAKGTPLIVDLKKRTAKVAKGETDEPKTNRLLYTAVKVEEGATVTAVNAADEVDAAAIGLSDKVVTALSNGRFLFI